VTLLLTLSISGYLNFHVFKAVEFLPRAGDPVFSLWGCEGFSPRGVVI
jgi:hypothetical protein